MSDDPRTQPLREWNRLARENTENAIVSSMFKAVLKASDPIESFSSWLLVATAAVASFLIANGERLIPYISRGGFITCGALLCVSCICGLLSKVFAVQCKIGAETSAAVQETFTEHLATYKQEEEKIQEGAKFWGIDLQSAVRIERVLHEFLLPFPKWARWFSNRHLKKHASNPQIGYLIQVKNLQIQGLAAFLQALCFLGFLIAGFAFAAAI